MRTSTRLLATLALVTITACSGSSSSSPGATKPGATAASTKEQKRQEALARHQARQDAACERVGTVITDCAMAELRATLSAAELAELDLEAMALDHRGKFVAECLDSAMSPRQVKVFEDCLADTTCGVFVTCLDKAKPQK